MDHVEVAAKLGYGSELFGADLATFRQTFRFSSPLFDGLKFLRVIPQVVSLDLFVVGHDQVAVLAPVKLLLVGGFEVPLKPENSLELFCAEITIKFLLWCFWP